MVAVLVHEVIGVAFELLAKLLHDLVHVLFREVGGPQDDGLPVENRVPISWSIIKRKVKGKRWKPHLNLKVSPSSAALPGLISKMPLKGYGWPPYANSSAQKKNVTIRQAPNHRLSCPGT